MNADNTQKDLQIIAHIDKLLEGVNIAMLGDRKLFIHKENDSIKVYDSICPHQGAILHCDSINTGNNTQYARKVQKPCQEIYCKVHNWRFDAQSGNALNLNAKLIELEAHRDSKGNIAIYAPALHSSVAPATTGGGTLKNKTHCKNINPHIKITLHGHATLEFCYKNFSLLCDPWLVGYAFFGAWRTYPNPVIKPSELKPNAIYISHEHSDHFHPETLKYFDTNLPIYIPAFPNGRLEQKLHDLGFCNVIVLPFGKRVEIAQECFITIYEPASLWNDSQMLLEIDSFTILNINDAGINHRILQAIGSVDMLCASFSPGASGYPATYTHLSDKQKISIYEKSRVATLEMLQQACKLYSAAYFLPFASHFILNHPKHLCYLELVRKNTIYDVENFFNTQQHNTTKVIALLAGDTWTTDTDTIQRQHRNTNIYEKQVIQKFITEHFSESEFNMYYPNKQQYVFDKTKVQEYFINLNAIPEIAFCEDMSVSIYPDSNAELAFSFCITNGKLRMLDFLAASPNLTINIPSEILMYIVIHNESWDEATIGYWCECSRNPDIYHAEFWRMLQAPYYLKSTTTKHLRTSAIGTQSTIADVLENLGEQGHKILARYGLYCLSCDKAVMESIELACKKHGIDTLKMNRMVRELQAHDMSNYSHISIWNSLHR